MPVNQVQNAGAGRAEAIQARQKSEQDAQARREQDAQQAEREAQAAQDVQRNNRNDVDMRA